MSLPPCPGDQYQNYHVCVGTYTYASGNIYVGEWKDGKWNGKGTLTFASGEKEEELAAVSSSYVGEFKEGKRYGKGTYIYINGDKYVGEFKDNKRHGHGTYHHTSGNKYVGEYKDGKKNGQGTLTFVSGYKFVGAFKNGKVRWSQKMGKHSSPAVPIIQSDPVAEKILNAVKSLEKDKSVKLGNKGYVIKRAKGKGAKGFVVQKVVK